MSNPLDDVTRRAKENAAAEDAAKAARSRLTKAWKRSLDREISAIFRENAASFGRVEDSAVFPPEPRDKNLFGFKTKLEGGGDFDVEVTSEASVNGERLLGVDPTATNVANDCWLKFKFKEKATGVTRFVQYTCSIDNSTGSVTVDAAEVRALIRNELSSR